VQGYGWNQERAASGRAADRQLPAEAVRLLTRRQWREGDVAALQAVTERLGLDVPLEGFAPCSVLNQTPTARRQL
jgi:hypothetical protein